jgi:phosphonate transport system substrate-binding protein
MKAPGMLLGLLFAIAAGACGQPPEEASGLKYRSTPASGSVPALRFAVHPLHNPKKLAESYQPLIDLLNARIPGQRFELEASRDYRAYEEKFRQRQPEFLLPNPWQSIEAIKVGYRVIAMAGDAEDFKGIFIVRKDAGIRQPGDLRGKAVSYPSPTALAASIMPQYFLHSHGINVNKDISNVYVGSQESSIMNVYLGQTAAGATWPPPWRLFQQDHPSEAAQLEVIWETPPLLNNSVMVRDDVRADVAEQVRQILLELAGNDAGQHILAGMATARFHPADNATYAQVSQYIANFERDVRAVEAP